MDERVRLEAETVARLLLEQFREEHPHWQDDCVPVDDIAAWLGMQLATFHPDDQAKGTYGYVDPDEEEHLIWLCRNLSETLRRFTLAHELGHVILHCPPTERAAILLKQLETQLPLQYSTQSAITTPELSREDLCHEQDVQEGTTGLLDQEQFQEVLGIGQSYDPRSQREIAANIFAAELLMPLSRVRTLYLEQHVPAHTLPELFSVSSAALLHRLTGLLKAPATASASEVYAKTEQPQPKKQYDEFQQAAIQAATPALITAGPGSGKTSTLIGRIEYMVHTQGIAAQHILALTFSRKAAQEMEERLQLALHTEDLPKVSTFHAFCADLLRQHGHLVGLRPDFALIDEAEGYFLLRQCANDMRLRHYQNLHNPAYYFPDMLKAISRAKDELVAPDQYMQLAQQMRLRAVQTQDEQMLEQAERAIEVAEVYQLYEQALQQRGDSDFGGLLVLTIRLLRQEAAVLQMHLQHYQHILVDEFQDMNRASGVLLRELAGEARRVWVVGDANQAIYGFRGASPANISNFEQDFPGASILPLNRNYRSRPDLVALAESFRSRQLEFGQEPTEHKNQAMRITQPDTYVTLAHAPNDASELAGLVQDIRARHEDGYAYKDIVVLCRTRTQAQRVSQALVAADLPVIERSSLLEQSHSKDILALALLFADGSGMGLLRLTQHSTHPLSQVDLELFLMVAQQQGIAPGLFLFHDEALHAVSEHGRKALKYLADMLRRLQYAPDIWSLLAHYLFLETTRIQDLLAHPEDSQSKLLLNDYDALLHLARHYDGMNVVGASFMVPVVGMINSADMVNRHDGRAEAGPYDSDDGANVVGASFMAPVAGMHDVGDIDHTDDGRGRDKSGPYRERVKGFLEYLSLLVTLRQDGGNRQGGEGEDEESSNVIRVMTVHASKGLEFPIVYLPGLVQRRFPLQARSSPVPPPLGMLPAESEGSKAHESGEACLFYVGVTRARDHLILSYSDRYGKVNYKRSPYLDALGAGLAEDRFVKLHWEAASVSADDVQPPSELLVQHPQLGAAFIEAMQPKVLRDSAIEAYLRCPRQYAYSYLYHFGGEEGAFRRFWQATQKTVEVLHQSISAGKGANDDEGTKSLTVEQARVLYTQHWQEERGYEVPFASMYEQHGHEIVEQVLRDLNKQDDTQWALRSPIAVDIAGKSVQVTVDRVEQAQQTGMPVKFVRARFGKRKDKPTADTRELFYARAYRQQHPGQPVELHSHNMSTGEMQPMKLSAKKEQSLYDEVEQAILAMERHEYPAQPAEPSRCPSCPFFFICPA